MTSIYTRDSRPPIDESHTYDVHTAQHFLADHTDSVIVAFDYDAMNPEVTIYTETPEGTLSPGDYYLWPLLRRTADRIRKELEDQRKEKGYRL